MASAIILTAIFTLVGFVFQIGVLPALGVTAIAPNMIIGAMVPAALLMGPWAGIAVGFLGGLAVDLMTGLGIGMTTMFLTICGFLVGLIKEQVIARNIVIAISVAVFCHVALDLWSAALLYLNRMAVYIGWATIGRTLLSAVLTALVVAVNHIILRRAMGSGSRRSPYLL